MKKQKKITIPLSKEHLLDHECRIISLEERVRRLEYPNGAECGGVAPSNWCGNSIQPKEDTKELRNRIEMEIIDWLYLWGEDKAHTTELADKIIALVNE